MPKLFPLPGEDWELAGQAFMWGSATLKQRVSMFQQNANFRRLYMYLAVTASYGEDPRFETITYFGKRDKGLASAALELVDDIFVHKYIKHFQDSGDHLNLLSWLTTERAIRILEEMDDDAIRVAILQGANNKQRLLDLITTAQVERFKLQGRRSKINYIATTSFLALLPESAVDCGHCGQRYKDGERFHFLCSEHTEHFRSCFQWASLDCDLCWPLKPRSAPAHSTAS